MAKVTQANPDVIGGGAKKVLYTLNTVRRIGIKNSAKALKANNACKACGLGMGGQQGGMTNELGEFPSVCNKSIQAQSTDIQPPIPEEVFQHSLEELRELSAHELEHIGRLGTPVYKAAESARYTPVTWDWALDYAAQKFAQTRPERSFFYASGRSSNEAGFILQLLARAYGTNNVNNCSYYCHQATGVGLQNSIGTGTATVELEDLLDCDLIFVIGANPASNHPRFIHKLKSIRDQGGQIVIINPAKEAGLVKFAVPKSPASMLSGGTWIATHYLQPNIGTDLAVVTGIAKWLMENNAVDESFIATHTENYALFQQQVEQTSWQQICDQTGLTQEAIATVAQAYARAKKVVFAWGMGITHHTHGVENVEAIANLALLRGMVGKRGAGLLPLRGHSNVQGIGTVGVKPVLAEEVFANMERTFGISLPSPPGFDTMASLAAATDGNIDAAILMGGNLYGATPDSAWAQTALNRIGFKLYLTTTLNQGHLHGMENSEALILPVTARDEEPQPTTQESMFNFVRLSDGGIERLSNVRSEVDILCSLAEKLLPSSPIKFASFKQHRTVRESIAKIVPGMEELADIDVAKKEFHVRGRLLHTPEFKTTNGKARFNAYQLNDAEKESRNSFKLMTVRSEGQFNTMIYEEKDTYRKTDTRWSVLLNADDIKALGIKPGELVDLASENGVMNAVKTFAFDIPRGNAMAYYPEANVLAERKLDPRSKTPNFKSITIRVSVSDKNYQRLEIQ